MYRTGDEWRGDREVGEKETEIEENGVSKRVEEG